MHVRQCLQLSLDILNPHGPRLFAWLRRVRAAKAIRRQPDCVRRAIFDDAHRRMMSENVDLVTRKHLVSILALAEMD